MNTIENFSTQDTNFISCNMKEIVLLYFFLLFEIFFSKLTCIQPTFLKRLKKNYFIINLKQIIVIKEFSNTLNWTRNQQNFL